MSVLLFALWIVLNGKVNIETALFGVAVSAAVTFFTYRAVGWNVKKSLLLARNLPLLAVYVLRLIFEIVISAASVMRMVYRADEPDPVIVEFYSGFDTSIQNVLLANSITLTPGTVTVFQEKDHFVVHALDPAFAEGIEDSAFVRLLSKMRFQK